MLKIRYNKQNRLLTGWGLDVKSRFKGESIVALNIPKPDSNDYENYRYIGGELVPSGKPIPTLARDLLEELDELKAKVNKLGMG